jgi:hypothetical protein
MAEGEPRRGLRDSAGALSGILGVSGFSRLPETTAFQGFAPAQLSGFRAAADEASAPATWEPN